MKYFLAFCVFILALGAGIKSIAAGKAAPTEASHAEYGKKSKDWTHKRLEQIAAVLPEPTADKTKVVKPVHVKLLSPQFLAAISGTSAKLEWTDSKGSKFYHIQVSKDAGFNNRSMYVADDKWVKGTSFEVSNLEAGQKYFWRVAAVNNENDSMFTKSLFVSSAFETK
jgi:hypothetical protein